MKKRSGRGPGHSDFHRPVVWITGASRGIGEEIAHQFASIGCIVCLSGRTTAQLQRVAREIHGRGGIAEVIPCDVSKTQSVFSAFRSIEKKRGPVDVLVCNAGVTTFQSFLETPMDVYDDIIDTNLRGHIVCVKAVLPSMVKRKRGWIFNISSNAAVKTFPGASAYSTTKAGLLAMMKVLREEVKRHNVKVINVLPGPTETEMWSRQSRRKFSSRMMRARSVAEVVLSAFLAPEDVVIDELILRPVLGDIE